MKKLIKFTKEFLVLVALWCLLSFAVSLVQSILVSNGSVKCETEVYIEYVVFTDLFCEVQK